MREAYRAAVIPDVRFWHSTNVDGGAESVRFQE